MIVSSHNLNFHPDRLVTSADGNNPTVALGRLNDWALSQIEGRLDAPARWMNDPEHCPDELRSTMLDFLTAVRPEMQLLTRLKGENIRAVLSDQYTPYDNVQLLDMVVLAMQASHYQPEVHRPEVGDNLRAYVLLPNITFGNDTPDQYGHGGLHPAVYVRNSEIGNGKVRITSAVYRMVCGNGVIYGWNEEESFEIRHRFIKEAMMQTLVADALATSLKMSEQAANDFIASQNLHVDPKQLDNIVDTWAEKYGITVEAKENWLATITGEATSYGRTNDPRVFDLVNAATYVAQNRPTDEREQMERLSGDLLRSRTYSVEEE